MPKGLLRYRNDGIFANPARRELAAKPEDWPWATSGTGDASFTGQNSDTVSSLYDFTFRRFSPSQGRWISPDPAGLAAVDPANPQTWNRYAYVANNPLSFVDPLGLQVMGPPGTPGNGDPHNQFDPTGDGSIWGGAIAGIVDTEIAYYELIFNGVSNGTFNYEMVPVLELSDLSFFGSSWPSVPQAGTPVFSGAFTGGRMAPNNPQQRTPQGPQHFWQKPGCLGSIGVTALGSLLTVGEGSLVVWAGPEIAAGVAAEYAEGGVVAGTLAGAHVGAGILSAAAAPLFITGAGIQGIENNCR